MSFRAFLIVITCGIALGFFIGLSGVSLVLVRDMENCTHFSGPVACNAASKFCFWSSGNETNSSSNNNHHHSHHHHHHHPPSPTTAAPPTAAPTTAAPTTAAPTTAAPTTAAPSTTWTWLETAAAASSISSRQQRKQNQEAVKNDNEMIIIDEFVRFNLLDSNSTANRTGAGYCAFLEAPEVECHSYTDKELCENDTVVVPSASGGGASATVAYRTADFCRWRDDACIRRKVGWSPLVLGLYTSLLCVGSTLFVWLVLPATRWLGRGAHVDERGAETRARPRVILIFVGVAGFLVSAASQVAFWFHSVPGILALRVAAGMPTSFMCVSIPIFVNEFVPFDERRTAGAAFQGATAFGIVLITAVALVVRRTIDWANVTNLPQRLQCVLGLNALIFLVLILQLLEATKVGYTPRLEPVNDPRDREDDDEQREKNNEEDVNNDNQEQEYNTFNDSAGGDGDESSALRALQQKYKNEDDFERQLQEAGCCARCSHKMESCCVSACCCCCGCCCSNWREWAVAVLLPACQQASGVNTQISYAVILAQAVGMDPLIGATVMTAVNSLASIVAVFIAKFLPFSRAFVFGIVALCLTNVVSFCAFMDDVIKGAALQNDVAFGASLAFLIFYELLIASTYYPLATRAVSPPNRSAGMTVTLFCETIFSFSTNFFFPLFIDMNIFDTTREGTAWAMAFYAGVAFVAAVLLKLWLKAGAIYK